MLLVARMNEISNSNSKNLIFDNKFLNIHFSIPMACKDSKFCLDSLYIHSEGTVSQIFYLDLGFYCM